jgi:hypothetical protein
MPNTPELLLITRKNPLLENVPVTKDTIETNFNLAIQIYTFENFLHEHFLKLEKIESDRFLKENTVERYRRYFSSKLLDASGKMLHFYLETTENTYCSPSEVAEFHKLIVSFCEFEESLFENYLTQNKLTNNPSDIKKSTQGKVMKNLNPPTHKKN